MILTDIFDALHAAGIPVYLAANAPAGDVDEGYIVIADGGITPMSRTNGRHDWLVTAFVPYNRTTDLVELLERARQALNSVDNVTYTGEVSGIMVDDTVKAAYQNAEYVSLCSLI